MVIGTARVRLLDTKAQVDAASENARLASFADGPIAIDWNAAADLAVAAADLESAPREGAAFHELPAPARDAKAYARWSKDYADWLYQTQTVHALPQPVAEARVEGGRVRGRLPRAPRPGRARGPRHEGRCAAREVRDQGRIAAVEAATAQQAVDREKNQEHGAGLQAAVSVAGSILGGFLGRKSVSVGAITSVARGAGRVAQQHDDVTRARGEREAPRGPDRRAAGVVRAGPPAWAPAAPPPSSSTRS